MVHPGTGQSGRTTLEFQMVFSQKMTTNYLMVGREMMPVTLRHFLMHSSISKIQRTKIDLLLDEDSQNIQDMKSGDPRSSVNTRPGAFMV